MKKSVPMWEMNWLRRASTPYSKRRVYTPHASTPGPCALRSTEMPAQRRSRGFITILRWIAVVCSKGPQTTYSYFAYSYTTTTPSAAHGKNVVIHRKHRCGRAHGTRQSGRPDGRHHMIRRAQSCDLKTTTRRRMSHGRCIGLPNTTQKSCCAVA